MLGQGISSLFILTKPLGFPVAVVTGSTSSAEVESTAIYLFWADGGQKIYTGDPYLVLSLHRLGKRLRRPNQFCCAGTDVPQAFAGLVQCAPETKTCCAGLPIVRHIVAVDAADR